jgi:hypothetical protein
LHTLLDADDDDDDDDDVDGVLLLTAELLSSGEGQ